MQNIEPISPLAEEQAEYPQTKTVVQLDGDGYFIGLTQADLSPLEAEQGVYLFPSGAIDIEPPEEKAGHVAKWQNNEWHYLPDYRGTTAYSTTDKSTIVIDTVGDVPVGYTLIKPDSPLAEWDGEQWVVSEIKQAQLKTEQQAEMWERIKQKREQNTHIGCYVASIDKWFHADINSRQQYIFMRTLSQIPQETMWKTMDNSFVEMTKALLDELSLALFAQEQADFANAERHRLQMLATESPLDYDFSDGWSTTYGN